MELRNKQLYILCSKPFPKIEQIARKAKKILIYIGQTLEDCIMRFGQGADILNSLGGFENYPGHPALTQKDDRLSSRQAVQISENNRWVVDKLLKPVQADPYFIYARLVEAVLLGTFTFRKTGELSSRKKREVKQLRKILENVGLGGELDRPSVEEYLRRRDGRSVRQRMRHGFVVLSMALSDPDYQETTVFD